jgi:urea transport system substrate-binding protein
MRCSARNSSWGRKMTVATKVKQGVAGACVAAALSLVGFPAAAQSGGTIKVGILHSLSGTMAISETTLKDVMLMLIEEQNKKGGMLGNKLEAVVVDPASNWPLFAEKARELIQKDKGRGRVRLLELGQPQISAAGI